MPLATGQQADPLDMTPPTVAHEYRLGISIVPHPQGLLVKSVSADSPAKRMRSMGVGDGFGIMESGDVIAAVNGVTVKSASGIHRALDESEGHARLSLIDTNTGLLKEWDVDPFRVVVQANRQPCAISSDAKPILFAFLIADTNDSTIGEVRKVSLDRITQLLERRVRAQQLELKVLEGDDCRAASIVRELALVPSSEIDSILVYYLGHGSFDPRYGQLDPSGGHFMDFRKKDLLRRSVWEYLNAAPARFRVVVTDACNVEGEADPFKYRMALEVRMVEITGATNLEWLLLGYEGELDLSAAGRGQFAWYSNQTGGFFSKNWTELARDNGLSDWDSFLDRLHQDTNAYYQQQRGLILQQPAGVPSETLDRLRNQTSMLTTTFRRRLNRDFQSPVDPDLVRTIKVEAMSKVRVR